jgi:hypothetical protein
VIEELVKQSRAKAARVSFPDEVAWSPQPKQAEFLAAAEDEVLYGGAAGGGKSDALITDAMGLSQNALEYPTYQAVLFRRTYPELRDLIERSHATYAQNCPGARYNSADHVWTWPSGAKVEFAHIQHAMDRYKYRGRQYAYIGWDELTLFPDDVCYRYLMSRLRSPQTRLKCYVRATTNPDGPGHKWVKERWAIPNEGGKTCFKVDITDEQTGVVYSRWRRFIPARLDDNKYLSETEYRIQLLDLPPEERDALLRGRWDGIPVKGAFYAEDIGRCRREGRITKVPVDPGLPVDTYWDLGHSDNTSIVFHQQVGLQDRFPLAYENSSQPLSHYANVLRETRYVFGTHYLPHDADHVRLGKDEDTTKSWRVMLQDLLPGELFVVVPRVEDVMLGISQTRGTFHSAWFDADGCADLVAALENHRREWDERAQVYRDRIYKDWTSHYCDAYRQFGQWRAMGKGQGGRGGYRRRVRGSDRNPLNV